MNNGPSPGLPGKRELVRRWQADSGLIRSLMPLLETALDLCPDSPEKGRIEAQYALTMERYLAAQEAIHATVPQGVILTLRRRW